MQTIIRSGVISLLLILSCNINAQFNKGRVLVGEYTELRYDALGMDPTNFGYATVKYKNNYGELDIRKEIALNLMPKIGYFVADNLVVGLDVTGVFYWARSSTNDGRSTIRLIGGGPFVRYYVPLWKVHPFLEVNGSAGLKRVRNIGYITGNSDNTYHSYSWGGGIGMAAPLSEKVIFDIMAGYKFFSSKVLEENDANLKTITSTMGIKLGFSFLFGPL